MIFDNNEFNIFVLTPSTVGSKNHYEFDDAI